MRPTCRKMRMAGTYDQSCDGFVAHWINLLRYHTHPKLLPYPAKHVNLRGVEEEKYVLIDITEFERGGTAKLVEEIEISRALFEVYEGGVVRTMWFHRRSQVHTVSTSLCIKAWHLSCTPLAMTVEWPTSVVRMSIGSQVCVNDRSTSWQVLTSTRRRTEVRASRQWNSLTDPMAHF